MLIFENQSNGFSRIVIMYIEKIIDSIQLRIFFKNTSKFVQIFLQCYSLTKMCCYFNLLFIVVFTSMHVKKKKLLFKNNKLQINKPIKFNITFTEKMERILFNIKK